MAERPTKRLRRLSTEYDDSEGNDDWILGNNDRRCPVQTEARALDRYVVSPTYDSTVR